MQQQAPMMGGQAPTIEQLLRALFYNLHFILLLIVPAVTMASFSEEKKSHALRLLMTAPCSATDIVLGKFLSALGIMSLVLLASFVFPLFTMTHGNPDWKIIASSYLGIFLLMSSQIAFGLWVSSLTNNQFMAFLFTMFGLFLLLILNWMAGSLGSGVFESLLKYLASSDHVDAFFKGTLSVSHTAYFLCFTGMFLFFTNVTLDSQRWR
ncbi:MAG: ABC transporter permease, partial [Proteobacteria bacterium]|nr:ABC transporter permease [Pseudomonadota bacterium]